MVGQSGWCDCDGLKGGGRRWAEHGEVDLVGSRDGGEGSQVSRDLLGAVWTLAQGAAPGMECGGQAACISRAGGDFGECPAGGPNEDAGVGVAASMGKGNGAHGSRLTAGGRIRGANGDGEGVEQAVTSTACMAEGEGLWAGGEEGAEVSRGQGLKVVGWR